MRLERYDETVQGFRGDDVQVRRAMRSWRSELDSCLAHIREIAEGLTDCTVLAEPYYEDSAEIAVYGYRPATAEELADRDRSERVAFLAAKARYEADRERFES